MILKIDPEKAFGRIEWSFIRETLNLFQFPLNLINLIMSCITTSISILVNREKTTPFYPSRGIRQGDPLLPYIFILCMKRLSRSIDDQVSTKLWNSISISNKGPKVSHIFFVDDLTIFSRATIEDSAKCVFSSYCSNQTVNACFLILISNLVQYLGNTLDSLFCILRLYI